MEALPKQPADIGSRGPYVWIDQDGKKKRASWNGLSRGLSNGGLLLDYLEVHEKHMSIIIYGELPFVLDHDGAE
jgi:hypothetical protein